MTSITRTPSLRSDRRLLDASCRERRAERDQDLGKELARPRTLARTPRRSRDRAAAGRRTRNVGDADQVSGTPTGAISNRPNGSSPCCAGGAVGHDVGRGADQRADAAQHGGIGERDQELRALIPILWASTITTGVRITTTGVLFMKAEIAAAPTLTASRAISGEPVAWRETNAPTRLDHASALQGGAQHEHRRHRERRLVAEDREPVLGREHAGRPAAPTCRPTPQRRPAIRSVDHRPEDDERAPARSRARWRQGSGLLSWPARPGAPGRRCGDHRRLPAEARATLAARPWRRSLRFPQRPPRAGPHNAARSATSSEDVTSPVSGRPRIAWKWRIAAVESGPLRRLAAPCSSPARPGDAAPAAPRPGRRSLPASSSRPDVEELPGGQRALRRTRPAAHAPAPPIAPPPRAPNACGRARGGESPVRGLPPTSLAEHDLPAQHCPRESSGT